MLVQVQDGRAVKLKGDPQHAVTRGFLCGKVARYLEREYSPERLLYPQKRVGPKTSPPRFERIGWDEALDTIAERLKAVAREWGPEAILPYSYAGTMGLLNNAGMDRPPLPARPPLQSLRDRIQSLIPPEIGDEVFGPTRFLG